MALLIVDDDEALARALMRDLKALSPDYAANGHEALARLGESPYDCVLADLRMPGLDGMSPLENIRRVYPDLSVVLMTGFGKVADAVQALKLGAYDFIEKPFDDLDALIELLRHATDKTLLKRKKVTPTEPDPKEDLLFRSPAMQSVWTTLEQMAKSDATTLIIGETGTGKELAAKAVHRASKRKKGPFVAVNCSALTETLLESELFGYMKGAFTGATTNHQGLFEAANGGTIFLDEIGHITPGLQVRLLRVLQEGEVKRVGATETHKVDVRVVAATNVDLQLEAQAGRFRQDLFYRLNVLLLRLPPLRERQGDVSLLANNFLHRFADKQGKKLEGFSARAMTLLDKHKWPGNVRELENVVQRAVVLSNGPLVEASDLPPELNDGAEPGAASAAAASTEPVPAGRFSDLRRALVESFEQRYLNELMRQHDGNISAAARAAGVERSNFKRLLREHGLLQ
ncbi:MAG: sigma-54-dependent Fis family transcriptional regulator [Deltaproteobacteria bacterium]|nr:sigma-54-dependent Fis family transcriptional regulator [Deltaproteobacteria bacterium]